MITRIVVKRWQDGYPERVRITPCYRPAAACLGPSDGGKRPRPGPVFLTNDGDGGTKQGAGVRGCKPGAPLREVRKAAIGNGHDPGGSDRRRRLRFKTDQLGASRVFLGMGGLGAIRRTGSGLIMAAPRSGGVRSGGGGLFRDATRHEAAWLMGREGIRQGGPRPSGAQQYHRQHGCRVHQPVLEIFHRRHCNPIGPEVKRRGAPRGTALLHKRPALKTRPWRNRKNAL
jgi:hypothetical protein